MTNLSEKQAVTKGEITSVYDVMQVARRDTGWTKHLTFTDTNSGEKFQGWLYWNEDDGYYMAWETRPTGALADMCERPEFEYEVDSYTEDIWNR